MHAVKVQVFSAPPETSCPVASSELERVEMRLGDILPILIDACLTRRAWVRDFADEPITVSRDLYEVMLAYKALRKQSA